MLRGDRIEAEVWAVPKAQLGTLVAGISAPLAIGKIKLDDGRWLTGFVCEQYAVVSAEEITALGGWRTYLSGE